jgi:WhiB family redox-sensing transcriptional regulator
MEALGWQNDAACIDEDSNWWTEPTASGRWESRENQSAKRICASCTVRRQCLDYALDKEMTVERRSRHGIWGGTTPDERHRVFS